MVVFTRGILLPKENGKPIEFVEIFDDGKAIVVHLGGITEYLSFNELKRLLTLRAGMPLIFANSDAEGTQKPEPQKKTTLATIGAVIRHIDDSLHPPAKENEKDSEEQRNRKQRIAARLDERLDHLLSALHNFSGVYSHTSKVGQNLRKLLNEPRIRKDVKIAIEQFLKSNPRL